MHENKAVVLLVDDDDAFRGVIAAELERRGFTVHAVASGGAALAAGVADEVDVVLLDLCLPDVDGIEVLKSLRKREVRAGVVVLTGHGTIDTAIQAIRLGAYDYLEKPCPLDKLEMTIRKTCEHPGLLERQRVLQDGLAAPDVERRILGVSPPFQEMMQMVQRIAETEAATLILGETGSGKDVVANLLHTRSRRREAPFVVVNCATLHQDLLQSELFGHEKGAFSGAIRRKHGLFEVAHGGTIFLDEVAETSLEIQAMLLRVLETGCFRRLGGNQETQVDVRVLSASNRDLREAVSQGRFREDLYYRLASMVVRVPPLRERTEDIPILAEFYLEQCSRRYGRHCRFHPDALACMQRYRWPGNIRELIHVVEQLVLLAPGEEIRAADMPREVRRGEEDPEDPADAEDLPSLDKLEAQHVQRVLEHVRGNRARAAAILGISERHLYRLIKKYRAGGRQPPGRG